MLRDICEREAALELKRREWELVREFSSFVDCVVEEVLTTQKLGSRMSETWLAEKATERCYGEVLYIACREEGTLRQERALREVWNYVYPKAASLFEHLEHAEDCVQDALAKVWQKLRSCRQVRSFLSWTATIVRNACKDN